MRERKNEKNKSRSRENKTKRSDGIAMSIKIVKTDK
jgi:hypothetical protein